MQVTNRNKVAIAIITAFGSVAAAGITVFPQVWSPGSGETPAQNWSVEGEVLATSSPEPVEAEVYLMPASGSVLVTTTDDAGRFVFDNVPLGRYHILVRASESQPRSCGRGLIEEVGVTSSSSELSVSGAHVKYVIVEPHVKPPEGS